MSYFHTFFFELYPYLAGSVFLIGSLVRFDRDQYTWKADSSQMLRKKNFRLASNLFHVGILLLFVGHFFGLLTPPEVYHAFGLSAPVKQVLSMVAGGIFGLMMLVGLTLLLRRRLTSNAPPGFNLSLTSCRPMPYTPRAVLPPCPCGYDKRQVILKLAAAGHNGYKGNTNQTTRGAA